MRPADRIRNVAVGLVVRDGCALVEIYPATALHAEFARALGGGIEYGETAADAIRREFVEELGIELAEARLLAVTENIFDAGWARGHEVALDALQASKPPFHPPGVADLARQLHGPQDASPSARPGHESTD